jgi:hypothetical protein
MYGHVAIDRLKLLLCQRQFLEGAKRLLRRHAAAKGAVRTPQNALDTNLPYALRNLALLRFPVTQTRYS